MVSIEIIKITEYRENETEDIKGEVLKDDIRTAELYMPAGISHAPEKDAEGPLLYVGSGKSYGIVLGSKIRNSAIKKKPGETFIYNLKNGVVKSTIFIDENNKITITADNADVEIDGNNVKINGASGNVEIDGTQIQLNGTSKSLVTFADLDAGLQATINQLIAHTHPYVDTPVGASTTSISASPISLNISAAEAASLKTDG